MSHVQKKLKSGNTFLDRWKGANATVWERRIAHNALVIRLTRPGDPACLEIYLGDVSRYTGPLSWHGAELEVMEDTSGGDPEFLLRDVNAALEVSSAVCEFHEKLG